MRARVTPAVADALARPAIPNGRRFPVGPAGASTDLPPEARSRAVVLVQPGIGGWECDGCGRTGHGGFALLAHYSACGSTRYTPRGAR